MSRIPSFRPLSAANPQLAQAPEPPIGIDDAISLLNIAKKGRLEQQKIDLAEKGMQATLAERGLKVDDAGNVSFDDTIARQKLEFAEGRLAKQRLRDLEALSQLNIPKTVVPPTGQVTPPLQTLGTPDEISQTLQGLPLAPPGLGQSIRQQAARERAPSVGTQEVGTQETDLLQRFDRGAAESPALNKVSNAIALSQFTPEQLQQIAGSSVATEALVKRLSKTPAQREIEQAKLRAVGRAEEAENLALQKARRIDVAQKKLAVNAPLSLGERALLSGQLPKTQEQKDAATEAVRSVRLKNELLEKQIATFEKGTAAFKEDRAAQSTILSDELRTMIATGLGGAFEFGSPLSDLDDAEDAEALLGIVRQWLGNVRTRGIEPRLAGAVLHETIMGEVMGALPDTGLNDFLNFIGLDASESLKELMNISGDLLNKKIPTDAEISARLGEAALGTSAERSPDIGGDPVAFGR